MLRTCFLFIILFVSASFTIYDNGTYESSIVGKKLSETLFGTYVKEELPGDQMIIVVGYGCDHCWDATKELTKLKKENLLDDIIVLGTGTAEEKISFKKETETNYTMIDYDFESMKQKIKALDPDFPPPPFAIWVKNNVIKAIFVKIPSESNFKKMRAGS